MGLQAAWYRSAPWLVLLRPLSWLYRVLVARRRQRLSAPGRQWQAPVPVVIVGNINLGGSGKTPLTLALIELLRRHGYRPGVVSRGYGAKPPHYPFRVNADTVPSEGGDEPCLLVRRSGVPLVIDPDRVAAARALLAETDCNLIISDDGLQHYALGRDLELAVVDGARGLGNARCLPEGPLREPLKRLQQVDRVILNGEGVFDWPGATTMRLQPGALVPLAGTEGAAIAAADLATHWTGGARVHALAGIGHPQRFFASLRELGFDPIEHPLADHAPINPSMLHFDDAYPLLMTEKDAVKCMGFAPPGSWMLSIDAVLEPAFEHWFIAALNQLSRHQGSPRSDR